MAITMKNALQLMYRDEWFEKSSEILGIIPDENMFDNVSAFYADPPFIENRLLQLHDDEVRLLEALIRQDILIPSENNHRCAERLITTELACILHADLSLGIIDEVRDVYSSLDLKEFNELRTKVSWLTDCLHIIPFMYGILPVKDLCDLYRKRKGFDDTNEEILFSLYRRITDNPVSLNKNELCTEGLNEAGNEAKLRQIHKSLPVSLPSYAEIRDITENGYPSHSKPYMKLKRFFIRELKQEPAYADALMEMVYNFIAKGNPYQSILEVIEHENIEMDAFRKLQLRSLIGDCWDDTRMLMARGARPVDLHMDKNYIFFGEYENE